MEGADCLPVRTNKLPAGRAETIRRAAAASGNECLPLSSLFVRERLPSGHGCVVNTEDTLAAPRCPPNVFRIDPWAQSTLVGAAWGSWCFGAFCL